MNTIQLILKFFIFITINNNIFRDVMTMELEEQEENSEEMPRQQLVELLQKKQHYQDIFSEQLSPLEIMFGHVCENPQEWEQRYEKNNMNDGRYQGKIRWGNRNGDYGEHYWDINHRR